MNLKLKKQVEAAEKLQGILWCKSGANGYGPISPYHARRWLTLERVRRLALARLNHWFKIENSIKRCGYYGFFDYLGGGRVRVGNLEKSISSMAHRLEGINSFPDFISKL